MSSAAEARFRIQAPNSKPRAVKIVALDAPSVDIVRRLSDAPWTHADFFTFTAPVPADAAFTRLDGGPCSLAAEVDAADLVVMIAAPGGGARAAAIVGEACSLRRVTTTALIAGASSSTEQALAGTLAQLRPWSLMVVIANADDYIDDMLVALRA